VDGTFEFQGIRPGRYTVEVIHHGIAALVHELVVDGGPVRGLDLTARGVMFSGRIVMQDGSAVPYPALFGEVIVTTVSSPNIIASTLLPIAGDGTFGRMIDPDRYRVYLRELPDEYTIASIAWASLDLMKETLTVDVVPVVVEIRVARRTASSAQDGVKVQGTVVDGVSGAPAVAERATLCCRDSGVTKGYSTPMRPDGTFEFADVPPGQYTFGLTARAGQSSVTAVDSKVDVKNTPLSELTIASTVRFVPMSAKVVFADGSPLPADTRVSVVFTDSGAHAQVKVQRGPDGLFTGLLPIGGLYTVDVEDIPDGYRVKPGTLSALALAPRPAIGAPQSVPAVEIVFEKE
jgi:hypothetical protein